MGVDETREVVEEVGLCAKVMDHIPLVLRTISWEGRIWVLERSPGICKEKGVEQEASSVL